MRQARHQYSLAPHTAHYTVIIPHPVAVDVACVATEAWICILLAMSACPVTLAGQ